MNKGFIYESATSDFPIVALVFDEDGLVIHGQAVVSVEEGETFIRQALTDIRQVESYTLPK